MSRELVWEAFENGVNLIYKQLEAGADVTSSEVQEAFQALRVYVAAAASCILDNRGMNSLYEWTVLRETM